MELSGLLFGSIEFALLPTRPQKFGVPGLIEKSSISLFRKNGIDEIFIIASGGPFYKLPISKFPKIKIKEDNIIKFDYMKTNKDNIMNVINYPAHINIINDIVVKVNKIVIHTYQFLKLYLIYLYDNKKELYIFTLSA